MAKVYLDEKENTPCGGRVRYDVDFNDMIIYSDFTDVAYCRKCEKCSWHLICPEPREQILHR